MRTISLGLPSARTHGWEQGRRLTARMTPSKDAGKWARVSNMASHLIPGGVELLTLMEQKLRMLQIRGVKDEAVVNYRESLTTKEMRYHRLSRPARRLVPCSSAGSFSEGGRVENMTN